MKENSDIDGGGKGDTTRSIPRNQGAGGTGKRIGGNRSRARREQKDNKTDTVAETHNSASSTSISHVTSQSVKVLPQATAEQIRIAQLLSNGEEEKALKEKVNQVVELTGCDQDTAALSLHDCDGDVAQAVHMILDARVGTAESNGLDDQKQDEWQTTSKRHPKKSIGTSEIMNGQNHDGSSTDRGDDWDPKSKEILRERRNARRGASERRGGSRPRPGSGANEPSEENDRRRNRSERRGRGSARGRSDRGGRQRPNDSMSPGTGKEDSHFVNGSADNDFGAFQNDGQHSSSRDRGVPPRFDGARRGGRGNLRGGGGRVFSSRGGRGGRGRSRLPYGQFREKVPSGAGDGNSNNWGSDHNEIVDRLPTQADEGWDDMNEWDSVWRGETQVFTNSKVAKESEESSKPEDLLSVTDDKNDKLLAVTTVEDDDPAIVNSVSSAQLNEAAIAAFNHRATEAIKSSLGIGASIMNLDEPKPQRQPRGNERPDTSSTISSREKTSLRAALEEEILGGVGPKHARSKAPPPSKRPDKTVELPRMRGLPVDQSTTGLCFGFGLLDDCQTSPVKNNEESAEVETVPDSTSQPHMSSDPDVANSSPEANQRPESSIQEYLSPSLNSSFQAAERQPTPVTNSVSPVKPPSLSTTPNQYHSPLKAVDSEDVSVTPNDPFQTQTGSISSDLTVELSNKLSTRPESQQSSQTQTQETSHAELQSRPEAPTVPTVMDKGTQPTPSSSQQNTPNKAAGVSRSQQTNAPQNAGGQNILNTLPSAAMNALLNYSHLATQSHAGFPYINIPTMPQHGTIDYEQIVQQQQRIIYDLALQQQQHPQPQQPTTQTPPSQQQQQHHNQHQSQNVHQHEAVSSISTPGTTGSTVVNVSGSTSASGNGLKAMSSNLRNSTVGDVSVQSPTATALPGSALPHLQAVTSSVVPTSGVSTTAPHHNMFMPPGYAPYYPNYYAANPAAAAAAAAQAAAPPGHHPNAGAAPAYNPATFLSIMNSINQQPVSQALSSPPHFGSSMGVSKGQSNTIFGSYERGYGGNSTSGGFDEHMSDMKYSGMNTGKDLSSAYGGSSSGSAKPTSLGVGPSASAYHTGVTSGGGHRGNSSISESSAGTRNSGSTGLDTSSKSVTVTGTGSVAPGAGASGFPFTLTGNPGIYNPGYVPFMHPPHPHHHLAAQNQQERQGTNSGVPQGATAGSLPGGPQFGNKGNSSVFSKQATAILHQNYHASGTSATYWNSLK